MEMISVGAWKRFECGDLNVNDVKASKWRHSNISIGIAIWPTCAAECVLTFFTPGKCSHAQRTHSRALFNKQMDRKFIWLHISVASAVAVATGCCCRAIFFLLFAHSHPFIYLCAEVWMRWFVCVGFIYLFFSCERAAIFYPRTRQKAPAKHGACEHQTRCVCVPLKNNIINQTSGCSFVVLVRKSIQSSARPFDKRESTQFIDF